MTIIDKDDRRTLFFPLTRFGRVPRRDCQKFQTATAATVKPGEIVRQRNNIGYSFARRETRLDRIPR